MIFDTLAYSQRFKAAGFTDAQAEGLAETNREMLADEVVTKSFLQSELAALRAEFRLELAAAMNQLRAAMKELEMRLTLRMGAMAVAVVAALAAIIKL